MEEKNSIRFQNSEPNYFSLRIHFWFTRSLSELNPVMKGLDGLNDPQLEMEPFASS